MQLIINVLKTDRVYEKSKLRLYLHDCNGFQGLICLMQGQTSSLDITHLLTDVILSRGKKKFRLLIVFSSAFLTVWFYF